MEIFLFLLIVMMASRSIMMASSDDIDIASRWKELSGHGEGESDNWQGLLSPLDNDLRRYIVHYGERTGAIGDLYDSSTKGSKSAKEQFFSAACLVNGNNYEYMVTDFIYAGSNVVLPSFFAYVAVTTDNGKTALGRRDILIVWRGTIETGEWFNNARTSLIPATDIFGEGTQACVHTGFLSLYTGAAYDDGSAKLQVRNTVRRLVDQYQNEEVSITVTGFSLGAALATLSAMDIVANGYNKPTDDPSKSFKVTAFVFAGPRVGDNTLQQEFITLKDSGLRLLRITNSRDPVPLVPIYPYVHLGDQELTINDGDSDFLGWGTRGGGTYDDPDSKPEIPKQGQVPTDGSERTGRGYLRDSVKNFFSVHNMDVYLHSVAGLQNDPNRPDVKFELYPATAVHDYALVNKYLGRLSPVYGIPQYWWEGENRDKMEQQDNGRWKVIA